MVWNVHNINNDTLKIENVLIFTDKIKISNISVNICEYANLSQVTPIAQMACFIVIYRGQTTGKDNIDYFIWNLFVFIILLAMFIGYLYKGIE